MDNEKLNPVLDKIHAKWPNLRPMVNNYRAQPDRPIGRQILNGIINAVLTCDVGYMTPMEVMYLSRLKGGLTMNTARAEASRKNGRKSDGRPRKDTSPPEA